MDPVERDMVRVYDEQGRKLPYEDFKEQAENAGFRPYQQLKLIHERRSRHARVADRSFRAVNTPDTVSEAEASVREYYHAPNRMDIEGIDTTDPRYKHSRVERAKDAFIRGGLINAVHEQDPEKMGEIDSQMSGAAGAFIRGANYASVSGGHEIHLSRGARDRDATLAHELGHALDDRLAGRTSTYSQLAMDDEQYAEQVREASVEHRGEFDDTFDTYRAKPTEQFADWFVGAVQEPRYTRATRGQPWSAIESRGREKVGERVDDLMELPKMAASRTVRDAVDEITGEREGWDYQSEESSEVYDYVREAQHGIWERFETEGHRERVESRVRDLEDDLKDTRISNVADFARLPIGDVWVDTDPLFEGSRKADLIPEEPIRNLEAMLGEPLDIPTR